MYVIEEILYDQLVDRRLIMPIPDAQYKTMILFDA